MVRIIVFFFLLGFVIMALEPVWVQIGFGRLG